MMTKALTPNPALLTRAGRFLDPQGRQVILHGINLVDKNPQSAYSGYNDPAVFSQLRGWGFNVIRLGVIWDGLEPEPGVFNESYLCHLDRQIGWARDNGLYVFLDMHQDLYSVLFSDGAPAWATLTDGQPHIDLGGVWSDAYFTSPAVQAALDNFWNNAPASDGVGLQEHYALAWQTLARRYADDPTVIGYDLMNEPFPGSMASASQTLLFQRGAELLAGIDGEGAVSAEELAMQWLDPQARCTTLELLNDARLFAQIIDVTQPIYSTFESGPLQAFYQRIAHAIREVDPQHILLLETSMGSNMGVFSAIVPIQQDGERDPQQAYAPHGYDLVVDTPGISASSPERVKLIFSRHQETARRHAWPILVGEWGAYGRHPATLPAALTAVGVFEQLLCSETYWACETDLHAAACFPALWRPYPARVAGSLRYYHCDWNKRTFDCTWKEDTQVEAPSIIYLPRWLASAREEIELSPHGQGFSLEPAGCDGAWVSIPPTGIPGERNLTVQGS